MVAVEHFLDILNDESQRLFVVVVVTAFILGIALLVVIFISQIRFLKNRLFEAKEIDLNKNRKISELQEEMAALRIKDEALEQELRQFEDTKKALQSKKELIFKMQERMNLLEEKEKEQLDTIEACSSEYQTLAFKYKGLQKRNVFLVEENSRFRADNAKILMKVREQERRIFEKLMSMKGDAGQQQREIEKLTEGIFEKNRLFFETLRRESILSEILPLNETMLKFQRETVSRLRKDLGREGDMQNDIARKIESRQNFDERIETSIDKLREEGALERAASEIIAYLLKLLGIEGSSWVRIERAEEEEGRIERVHIHLPDAQSISIETGFSLELYELYRQTVDREEREKALERYLNDFEHYVEHLASERREEDGGHWILIAESDALERLCRSDKQPCDTLAEQDLLLLDASMLFEALESVGRLWEYREHYRVATELLNRAEALEENFERYAEEIGTLSQRLEMIQESFSINHTKGE